MKSNIARNRLMRLIFTALMVAADVVLTRLLAINTPVMKIGLGFAATASCAIAFGPLWAASEAALGDFVGAILFPVGAYNPCFTVTAALGGLIFGLFLYKKPGAPGPRALSCLGAAALKCASITLVLNTLCIHWFFGVPLKAPFLITRLTQFAIMLPVEFLILWLLTRGDAIRRAAGMLEDRR